MVPANNRLVALDAVRGIAALMVVLFHFTTRYSQVFEVDYRPAVTIEWGYLGVHFFFMVSGFVIFMTLCRTKTSLDFVVSRFSRLFPAYWLSVAVTAAVVAACGLDTFERSPAQIAVNFTMLQGFLSIPNVDGVYWTLTFELIFYAWIYLAFRIRMFERIHIAIAVWLTVATATHVMKLTGIGVVPANLTFFGLLQYAHLFAAGMLFFLVYSGKATLATFALLALCIVDQVLVAVNLTETVFVLGFFAVFLIVATQGAKVLEWWPLVFMGSISYTLYLMHQYIGFAALDSLRRAGVDANIAVPLVLVAAIGLATLVSAVIERPAMGAIRRMYKTWLIGRTPQE